MTDKVFIDECLNAALVAVAKNKGVMAEYGPHIGKGGWEDRSIVAFALINNYILVANNRRHFLKEYIKVDLHNGLIIIVPSIERADQMHLFEVALDAALNLGDDVVNKMIEVLRDGSIHIREWTRAEHDAAHIDDPRWL